MKNILTNLMTSAVLLFTLGGGLQAQSVRVQASVPFAWQANGLQLNAGDYLITRDVNSKAMLIQGKTGGKGTFIIITPASDPSPAARLVFHRHGDQYFLAEVVAPGPTVGRLPVSRAEKEAMRSDEFREMATVFVDVKPVID